MKLAHCYRTLKLKRGASLQDVKASYRRLVRQYHPDLNPDVGAIEQFIKINDAYTLLVANLTGSRQINGESLKPVGAARQTAGRFDFEELRLGLEKLGLGDFQWPHAIGVADKREEASSTSTKVPAWSDVEAQARNVLRASRQIASDAVPVAPCGYSRAAAIDGSREVSLKRDAYSQLKALLQQQKFPRAIALVEGLAHRMPTDAEISQWQAIVYQRWGRLLIKEGQFQKARIYLKKALRTDPHNPLLCREINRDFWQLAELANYSVPVASHQ